VDRSFQFLGVNTEEPGCWTTWKECVAFSETLSHGLPQRRQHTLALCRIPPASGGVGVPDVGRSDKCAVGAQLLFTEEARKTQRVHPQIHWASVSLVQPFYKNTRVSRSLPSPFTGLSWASGSREPHTADKLPF